jgi:hypothetical protein
LETEFTQDRTQSSVTKDLKKSLMLNTSILNSEKRGSERIGRRTDEISGTNLKDLVNKYYEDVNHME